MTYRIKEVFYTIQGEGFHAGTPAVFVRFAGCNLWNGHEAGRNSGRGGCAQWCDTDFVGTDGVRGGVYTAEELARVVDDVRKHAASHRPLLVLTGGEPFLQIDAGLVSALSPHNYIAVETNGTVLPRCGVDWICVSPKWGSDLVLRRANELKLVWPQEFDSPAVFDAFQAERRYLQPKDTGDPVLNKRNLDEVIRYCMAHARWKVSLQTHKIMEVP